MPLHRQVENALRDAILSGRLRAGEKLLSIRDLQTHLNLSRNTIVSALSQLQAEGYLTFVRGVGTFVTERPVTAARNRKRLATDSKAGSRFIRVHELTVNVFGSVPFRRGIPAMDAFPSTQFKRAMNDVDLAGEALDHPSPFGEIRLREEIVRRLQQTRGIACIPEQVIITDGEQAALSLIADVLVTAGDSVVIEEPGYCCVRAIFIAQGARIVEVPVDKSGLDISKLPDSGVSLTYVTPAIQDPTGVVLSTQRRLSLLEWAEENGSWIVEDDYDSEFDFTGKPQPALHALDRGRRVLYVGTFNKVLTPALRLAYVIVPEQLVGAFVAAQEITGRQPGRLVQRAVANFMASGRLSRHVMKMRRLYNERRLFTSTEFARVLGPDAQVRDFGSGLHFVVTLPRTIQDDLLSSRAAEAGVTVQPLSRCFHGRPTINGIVVGYAAAPIAIAEKAIATIASLL